jgi:MotA/TolQ/ExbB proton channel family
MGNSLWGSLSLINASGVVIIAAIVVLLTLGVLLTLFIRARYALIARDLRRGGEEARFDSRVLQRIVQSSTDALRAGSGEINTQAIVEQSFQSELGGLLMGERFVKSMTGLVIIMGLVGTFYGLSSSIGRLTALLSGQAPNAADVASSLTEGLTETLSGMSVAFTSSLFGIVSAVLLTLLGVFLNIADRRLSVMVQIESYLDNTFMAGARASLRERGALPAAGGVGLSSDARVEHMVHGFGESVSRLSGAVQGFEHALAHFASSTRDFQEFNLHLKDNIQRMSLSFGDLSETLKQQVSTLRGRERG